MQEITRNVMSVTYTILNNDGTEMELTDPSARELNALFTTGGKITRKRCKTTKYAMPLEHFINIAKIVKTNEQEIVYDRVAKEENTNE